MYQTKEQIGKLMEDKDLKKDSCKVKFLHSVKRDTLLYTVQEGGYFHKGNVHPTFRQIKGEYSTCA